MPIKEEPRSQTADLNSKPKKMKKKVIKQNSRPATKASELQKINEDMSFSDEHSIV